MNAIRGALGFGIVILSLWLAPPDGDPFFLALPWKFRLLIAIGITLTTLLGIVIFVWGLVACEPRKHKGE